MYRTTVEVCEYSTIPLTLTSTILYMERAELINASVGEGRRGVNPLLMVGLTFFRLSRTTQFPTWDAFMNERSHYRSEVFNPVSR